MKVSDRFKVGISRYQPGDREDLAAFQREAFGSDARQLDPERFAWLFERNPDRDPDGPGLWLCRRNDKVVGQQAEIAFDLVVDGDAHRAAWGIDLMVDPEWRIRGVGPGLMATQLEHHDVVVGLTQAEEAFKSYMKSGWTDVGVAPVYVRPLDVRRFLQVAPLPAKVRKLVPAAGAIGLGFRGVDAVATGVLTAAGARLVPVDRFDERVDEAWAAAAPDYPVIARRDAATTVWRLDDRPDADRLRRFYLVRGKQVLGYAAFGPLERWGDQAAFMVDFLAPRRWLAPLLALSGRAARRDGAFALVCRLLCPPAERSLKAAGFIQRGVDVSAPLHLVLHSTAEAAVTEKLASSANWFLNAADSDLS